MFACGLFGGLLVGLGRLSSDAHFVCCADISLGWLIVICLLNRWAR